MAWSLVTLISTRNTQLIPRCKTASFEGATVLKSSGRAVQFNLNLSYQIWKQRTQNICIVNLFFNGPHIYYFCVILQKICSVSEFGIPKRRLRVSQLSFMWWLGRTQTVWFLFATKRKNSFVIVLFLYKRERQKTCQCQNSMKNCVRSEEIVVVYDKTGCPKSLQR